MRSCANSTSAPTWIIQMKQAYLMMMNNNKTNHMTHELLTPRYEVVAQGKKTGQRPYPSSRVRVGDILVMDRMTQENERYCHYPHFIFEHEAQEYPNLFRPMWWGEQRPIDDMPEYVKCVDSDCTEYFKVTDWVFNEEENCLCKVDDDVYTGIGYDYEGNITPATETEYLDYLKNK